jgi:4a-hydroxytetrahydrobiopterin dehydratase
MLSNEQCTGGADLLSVSDVSKMLEEVGEWEYEESSLVRRIECNGWEGAISIVEQVYSIVKEQNHHPDIEFGFGYVILKFSTHDAGGVTRNDFIMAAHIDENVA